MGRAVNRRRHRPHPGVIDGVGGAPRPGPVRPAPNTSATAASRAGRSHRSLADLEYNVYVCNMPVASERTAADDVLVGAVADATAPLDGARAARAVLIVGAPGFGKTSVLAAAAAAVAGRLAARVLWLAGGAIASEGHLARLLADAAGARVGRQVPTLDEVVANALGDPDIATVLAVDDFDALTFKRDRVAELLGSAAASGSRNRLLLTCRPAAVPRLTAPAHPLVRALASAGTHAETVTIGALDDAAAWALVRRRAPRLSAAEASTVVGAAGGHPAALVFLSRLVALGPLAPSGADLAPAGPDVDADAFGPVMAWAAEFAGAVYAEPWADLGPQQRAVLWQLARAGAATTASEVAAAIALPPSHVSAQLTRLVADGLALRTGMRGQFTLAPLLARWIVRRPARDAGPTPGRRRGDGAPRDLTNPSRPSARRPSSTIAPVIPRPASPRPRVRGAGL